jgi:hypothetical protein
MQRGAWLYVLTIALAGSAAADEACKEAVTTAFNKQRQERAFVMVSELTTPAGPVEIRAEYQPPDRMRQVVSAPNQAPLETVLFGKRAYSRQGEAKWEELMPAVAQTIIAQVRDAVVEPPKNVGDFSCVGNSEVDGKTYLAYRSVEKRVEGGAQEGPMLHRTIYVDPQSGLPALNVVAADPPSTEVIFKATYEYPENLEIEDHPDAPLVKMR